MNACRELGGSVKEESGRVQGGKYSSHSEVKYGDRHLGSELELGSGGNWWPTVCVLRLNRYSV